MGKRREKRKHGVIFSSQNEVREILGSGEKAIVIRKNEQVMLYAITKNGEEFDKLITGANVLYGDADDAEVIVVSSRMIPL